MGKLLLASIILALVTPTLGATTDELSKQTGRLEDTLGRQRRLQKTQTEMLQALSDERAKRFGEQRDEIAEALVTLPVKAFPNPTTASEKSGEMAIQTGLLKYATARFEELAKAPDSDLDEKVPALDPKKEAPEVTSFPLLKTVLDRLGDQVLVKAGALSSIAEMARLKAEAIAKQEKEKTPEEAKPADDKHPDGEAEEKPAAKEGPTLNQRIAEQFGKSAKAATEYFKAAEKLIDPVLEEEKQEAERPRDLASDPLPPAENGGKAAPPGGGAPDPSGGQPAPGQGQGQQAKSPNKGQGNGGGGGGGGSGDQGGQKSGSRMSAGQVPGPGGAPRVVVSDLPNEPDLSALSEVAQSLASRPAGPAFAPPGSQLIQPSLAKPTAETQGTAAERPTRGPASVPANTFPGVATSSNSSPGAESSAATPTKNEAVLAGGPKAGYGSGDAGIFNVGPKYPPREDSRSFRQNVGYSGGGGEAEEDGARAVAAATLPQLPLAISPLSLASKPEADRRGILSNVGHWCQRLGSSTLAACSK